MRNLESGKHVSIHQYRSEEITDVIGRVQQTEGLAAPFLFYCIEIKTDMTEIYATSA